MKAAARIVAESGRDGRTRLTVLSGEPPLLPRRTGVASEAAEVHLVGGAAGPLGGDALRIDIEVGAGAYLIVRTVAASIVLPGRDGTRSTTDTRAEVAGDGRLEWLPEPLVAVRGCRHLASSIVELSAAATLVWREEIVCGRHGEDCGDLTVATRVWRDGEPLLHQELSVGPDSPTWTGPATLGGGRATGTLLVVDPAWTGGQPPRQPATSTVAQMALTGPAFLRSAVAEDAHTLRKALHHDSS